MSILGSSLFTQLSADAAVAAILGTGAAAKLFPGIAPAGTGAPYAVWQEIVDQPDNTFGEACASGQRGVQISCVADTYLGVLALANAIRAALDHTTLAGGEVVLSVMCHDGYSETTDQHLRFVEATIFAAPDA